MFTVFIAIGILVKMACAVLLNLLSGEIICFPECRMQRTERNQMQHDRWVYSLNICTHIMNLHMPEYLEKCILPNFANKLLKLFSTLYGNYDLLEFSKVRQKTFFKPFVTQYTDTMLAKNFNHINFRIPTLHKSKLQEM